MKYALISNIRYEIYRPALIIHINEEKRDELNEYVD